MTLRTFLVGALAAIVTALPSAPGHAQTATTAAAPISAATVVRAAERVYAQDLQAAMARGALDSSARHGSIIRGAAQPIVSGASSLYPEAAHWSWAVAVETRDEPVAYCLPGGKILVSTGLVDRTGLTPVELSAVLAHAVAHAISGDDANAAVSHLVREGHAANADPNRTLLYLTEALAKVIREVPHSVEEERAADTRTLELMARLGLDPRPAVDAWRKIVRAGGATPPGFLALHPPWRERIGEIEAQMPAMVALYETALRERPPPPTVNTPRRTPRQR